MFCFQQIQIAADSGERGTQIMGNIGDRAFQLLVPLQEAPALGPKPDQLPVQGGSQIPPIAGRNVDQGVGFYVQPFGEGLLNLFGSLLKQPDFYQ